MNDHKRTQAGSRKRTGKRRRKLDGLSREKAHGFVEHRQFEAESIHVRPSVNNRLRLGTRRSDEFRVRLVDFFERIVDGLAGVRGKTIHIVGDRGKGRPHDLQIFIKNLRR